MADFLTEALKANVPKNHIADFLAEEQNFNIEEARKQGVPDDRIIAYLLGTSASSAFGSQFMQGFKSSAQGIGQMLGMSDREDIKAQREAADIMSSLNPVAGTTGSVVGNMLDLIALPTAVVAPLRGATLATTLAKKGAAQGAFSGFLEPITKEEESTGVLSLNRVLNSIISAPIGAAIGGGAGSVIQRLTKQAEVPSIKTEEVPGVKADEVQTNAQKALDELSQLETTTTRAVETPIAGEGVTSRMLSDAETQALAARKAQLQSEIDDLRWRQAETPAAPITREQQTAALLQGETRAPEITADGLPSLTRGLISPPVEAPTRQVPALFQKPVQEAAAEAAPIRQPQEPALFRGGIENSLAVKNAEIADINARLEQQQKLLEARNAPSLIQVETGKPIQVQRLAPEQEQAVLSKYGFTTRQEAEAAAQALTPVEKQAVINLQETLSSQGFKNIDESIVAKGTPEEAKAAQARIDSGNVQTLEQAVRGFRSGGSAAASPERLYSGTTVFPDVERAVLGAVMGERAPNLKIEKVKVADTDKVLQDTIGFLGKDLKMMREGGAFSGTQKGTIEAGIQAAKKAAAEEGSYLNWLFKEDDKGNFINIDKSWDRGEIAAFMPIVRDATQLYNRLMDEAVDLNIKGNLGDKALQDIMERMAYPIQIMGIFQGKRTQASRSLNAFKTLDASLKDGKTVKGFLNAGVACS